MLFNLILFFVLVFLFYAYLNHNSEFTATACAIRQIWSGSCRLSCRQSQYSSFSGLSGLASRTNGECSPGTSQARPAQCVCDTCPCVLIDNVLSTCRPITDTYYGALEIVSNYTCFVMQMLNDCTEYFSRVIDCAASCQRQAQLTEAATKRLDSSQNISFGNQDRAEERKSDVKVKGMKSLILRRKPAVAENKSAPLDEDNEQTKRSLSILSNRDSVEESSSKSAKSCSKCIEKGFTCMQNCPRAKKK